ncbi:MAG: hypothetical protein ER33_09725 [Cyanobium sp. CACIAM 14]|nr:MAG: hypothetical protein ER33_09725 [Cyanobium sp. CACIAM 14]
MQRTYLALAGLALAGAGLPLVRPPLAGAAVLFQSAEVEANRFAVLAKPVGEQEWSLLVLEQIATQPACWEPRRDGLVDPALNRFDYTGICNRYLDSNGYSLRVGDDDLATTYRLRVQQIGSRLELQATTADNPTILVVGRAEVPLRDRDGFVALRLDPGWELKRRIYQGRALSHLYFASSIPLEQLIATAGGNGLSAGGTGSGLGTGGTGSQPYRPLPALRTPDQALATGFGTGGQADDGMGVGRSGRAIALQVIPFSEPAAESR